MVAPFLPPLIMDHGLKMKLNGILQTSKMRSFISNFFVAANLNTHLDKLK